VFAGDAGGRFLAMDQETGEILWQVNLGSSVTGYPATFAVDGQQYVAVSTGRWLSDAFTPELTHGTQNTLFVFALPEAGIGHRGPERAPVNPRGQLAGNDPGQVAAGDFTRTVAAGVYSAAQAEAGRAVYGRACSSCHGGDFTPAPGVPPVRGESFIANWRGRSVGELFGYTREFMPPGAGRSLSDTQYLQVTAYLLQANDYPAGAELDPDEALLRAIGIE
jgi:alcohol dehydrogenase (cytochrome c)